MGVDRRESAAPRRGRISDRCGRDPAERTLTIYCRRAGGRPAPSHFLLPTQLLGYAPKRAFRITFDASSDSRLLTERICVVCLYQTFYLPDYNEVKMEGFVFDLHAGQVPNLICENPIKGWHERKVESVQYPFRALCLSAIRQGRPRARARVRRRAFPSTRASGILNTHRIAGIGS
ncbi:hypothetical protein EVAR_39016_1 [Eumeta japonica]|uniref:Uncharacterized protein n=1 Tax=Eumeta variegata TaxID=151549 RepID=A0A4C1WQP5_EUMVA|nr:hypothetical protein EVAR_39016_1 [Eumeta japonica]